MIEIYTFSIKTNAMKNFLLLFILVQFSTFSFSQWVPTTPVTRPAYYFFENKNKLFCSTDGLYSTNDNGSNWIKENITPVSIKGKPLSNIKIQNGNVFAGINLTLWKSTDNCKSWSNILPEILVNYTCNNNELLAITLNSSNKYLKISNDTGKTWTDITSTMPFVFNNYKNFISFLDGNYIIGNSKLGKLFYSNNKGISWSEILLQDSIENLILNDNRLLAISKKSFYISNNAINWVKKNIPETPEAISAKGDTLYASIDYGKIYRSYDGGDTWKKLPEDKDLFWANGYKNIFISIKGYLYAPATFGLKISKDKGESWYPSNTENFAAAECWGVDTLKNRIIASFGDYDSGSCISDDNGITWKNDYPIRSFYDIQVTEKVTYLSQFDGFFISYNNGSTWAKSDIDSSKYYSSILAIDKSVIVITDKGIYISENEGITWHKTGNKGVNSFITKIKTNGSQIYGLSSEGNIYYSDDKCENWVMISSNLPNFSNFRNIYCFEDLIVASGSSDLFVSKDNGKTWKSISNGLFYSSYKEIIYYKNKLIVGGTPAYISNESYTEWYPIEDNGQMYVDDNNGFAIMNGELFLATRFTGLFKYKLEELIKVSNKDISSSYNQNTINIFPNPVKDVLNIDIEQPIDATILDMDGKLILHPACPNQKIDVSVLKSGNYILKIKNKTREISQQFVKE